MTKQTNFTTIGIPQFQGSPQYLTKTTSNNLKWTLPAQEFINTKMLQVKSMSKKADKTNNLKRLINKTRATKFQAKYGAGYDYNRVKSILLELVNNGYNIAIDGDLGKLTEVAWLNYLAAKKDKEARAEYQRSFQKTSPNLTWFGRNIMKSIVDFVNGTPDEQRLAEVNDYANSKKYSYKDDAIIPFDKDGKAGQSRLGNLGLVKSNDGTYKLYDSKGNLVSLCAQTRNALERMLGEHKTDMNAWDGRGVYGDSTIFNGYKYLPKIGPYNKVTHTLQNLAAAVLKNFNNIDFLQGDVVDLYSMNSAHNDEAWRDGTLNRSNSHTGVVFHPNGPKKYTWIIHNVNGKVFVDPMSKFMVSEQGLLLPWAITGVHRPGTKEHPYTDKNGNYISK